jgi:hypothetical protein
MYAHHGSINGVHLSEMVFLILVGLSLGVFIRDSILLKIDHPCLVKILATQINVCDEQIFLM